MATSKYRGANQPIPLLNFGPTTLAAPPYPFKHTVAEALDFSEIVSLSPVLG